MKRLLATSIIACLTILSLLASDKDKPEQTKKDTIRYTEINGKVIDSQTQEPVVFASVFITGTNVATVTNNDGEFVLKVPLGKEGGTVSLTHLGYENKTIEIKSFAERKADIKLNSITMPIDEIVVKSIDPIRLLLNALEKVNKNYTIEPEMQTAFYRETIKQRNKYVSVSEAVLDIYKSPYKTTFDYDRMKIFKGRKSRDVKKMDTIVVKLQGGPRTSLLLDVVKNPGDILDRESFEYYNFELSGITTIDNRETYIIKFDQKSDVKYPLYKGSIYIDVQSNAFAGLDFSLSDIGLPYASKYLVKKKPSNMRIEVLKGHYFVRYRKAGEHWYLNYVRSELDFDSKWKKKLFKTDIHIMLEMAVTDRENENIIKFTGREMAKLSDIFVDQVSTFEDPNFWGDYNTIKPDESIEVAIEKLNKKLKRRQ